MVSGGKKVVFTIISVLLWLFVLLIVEWVLGLTKVGIPKEPFTHPKGSGSIYIEEFDYPRKYFSIAQKQTNPRNKTLFEDKKDRNILRGIIIGESTPQGCPFESGHAFGGYLRELLQIENTNIKIEIINSAYSAMSSYYVRDTAPKMLKYSPDFIVIYSGHNEYYGAVAQLSGGNHWSRLLYLKIKEIKIFQLLFDLFNPTKNLDADKNLMQIQFAEKIVKPDRENEMKVVSDYLDNIETILKKYYSRNIPVILIEPVCNLLDMPPFAGYQDERYFEFISNYDNSINSRDRTEIMKYQKITMTNAKMMSNANIVYLNARAKRQLNGTVDLDDYILAKDLDMVPFRARSSLLNGISDFVNKSKEKYPNLYYVPLMKLMKEKVGPDAFGNRYFIDHVHFNQEGHLFLAEQIAKLLDSIYTNELSSSSVKEKTDIQDLKRKIWYLPIYEYIAYYTIHLLFKKPPYTEMLITYSPVPIPVNVVSTNSDLVSRLFDVNTASDTVQFMYQTMTRYYIENRDLTNLLSFMQSQVYLYPGSDWPYLNLAKIYLRAQDKQKEAKSMFMNAYLLSGKNEKIKKEMLWYFPAMGNALK